MGVLSVLDSSLIDFETDDEHRLTVRVISGGDTVQASISVNILDANDNLPITRDTTVSISEDESLGRLIWTVPGEDLDVDDRATFAITSGNNENKFTIDANSGRISLTERLDYETTSSYTLSINVTSGGDVVVSTLTINVVNVNVSPIITVDSLFIDENTLAGTEPIGTITGVDEDLTQIIWRLPNDSLSDNNLFEIDSLTGQLSLKQDSTINYEFKDTLQIVIAATDDSSSTFEFIEIIVGNVNDAPTIETSTISVEENTPGGSIVGQVVADDEDFDAVLTYEIIDGEIFTIDTTTGEIILKSGETIDFEDKDTYTFEVVVSDGEYSDTTEITISVENIVETATISVVEIFDDSGRTVENTQEFYTSHDSVTIVYNKDGVLDSIKYSVDEGINIINEINNDPTKDIFEDVDVKVVVSKVEPEFEVVITSEIPVDTTDLTHHINDLDQDSIWVRITHVNQGLDTVYIDSLLAIDDFLVEGEVHEKVVVFEDVYGNVDSTTVRILLDTTFPILTILNPEDRSETDTLLLNVIWEVVDGIAIDTLSDEQLVSSGTFAIIRSYSDFAGNVAADTVIVTVTADDTGAKIAVIDDVVNQKTTDELIEYFEERDRTSDPAFDGVTLDTDGDGIPDIERANISVIMPNQSSNNNGKTTAIELAVQTDKGVIRREEEAEFVYDAAESKFGLNLELNFPINGGYTQDGRSRAGNIPDSLKALCDPDSTMFTLRVERIQFHIFDHIGQYVSKINIDGFDVSDPRYQNDNGKVNLMMEIPQLADGLTSEAGENWGTGVYIMSGVVQTSSTPKECLQDIDTLRRRTSSTSLMEEVGYKREQP